MEAQRSELLELVERDGWKVERLDNYDFHKWSMETWILQSKWSPINATAYVSFLIDPMSDFQNPYAWAIEVSEKKPVYGKEGNCFQVPLKQWKNEKQNLLKFLELIRNDTTK